VAQSFEIILPSKCMSQKKKTPSTLPYYLRKEESESVRNKVKFGVYGEEMIEKEVKPSGDSGRVYLPPDWVGKHVKIVRID